MDQHSPALCYRAARPLTRAIPTLLHRLTTTSEAPFFGACVTTELTSDRLKCRAVRRRHQRLLPQRRLRLHQQRQQRQRLQRPQQPHLPRLQQQQRQQRLRLLRRPHLHLHRDLVPHPGLHHHRGLVRLRPHVRDFCRLNPVRFAVGEAGLAKIEDTFLANHDRELIIQERVFAWFFAMLHTVADAR